MIRRPTEEVNHTALEADLELLEVLIGDATKLLANWRHTQPYGNPIEPDAVVAIMELQANLRGKIRGILNQLGEEEHPF